jgi:hypothetical protein
MAGHSRPKDGVLSHTYVTASRMYPTCGSFLCGSRASPTSGAIHVFTCRRAVKTWMPATSAGMTVERPLFGHDVENSMSPDLYFTLTLIVKMVVTAAFLLAATITAERAGPLIGGLVSTLPISAGPVYIFLALDHDAHFMHKVRWAVSSPMPTT